MGKLICVQNCCKALNVHLIQAANSAATDPSGGVTAAHTAGMGAISADDFLPVLIYVALHARVAHLHSNVMYIARYRHPSRLQGEAAYNLTNLSSVVAFL